MVLKGITIVFIVLDPAQVSPANTSASAPLAGVLSEATGTGEHSCQALTHVESNLQMMYVYGMSKCNRVYQPEATPDTEKMQTKAREDRTLPVTGTLNGSY